MSPTRVLPPAGSASGAAAGSTSSTSLRRVIPALALVAADLGWRSLDGATRAVMAPSIDRRLSSQSNRLYTCLGNPD
jgi:hypothetical protein